MACPLSWARVNVGTGGDGITERHLCDGSRPQADKLLIRPTWWARPVPATTADKSRPRHTTAARSFAGHTELPAPSLEHSHPGAPQRHSQIVCYQDRQPGAALPVLFVVVFPWAQPTLGRHDGPLQLIMRWCGARDVRRVAVVVV